MKKKLYKFVSKHYMIRVIVVQFTLSFEVDRVELSFSHSRMYLDSKMCEYGQ